MAYNTVAISSSGNTFVAPPNVITIRFEKDFLLNTLFFGDTDAFASSNTYCQIYEDENEPMIPLTSVIYTPNKRFFENSKFYKQMLNNKTVHTWLKKHNILVLVYGITSILDYSFQSRETYNESMIIMDIIKTSGCLTSPYRCIPAIFSNHHNNNNNDDDESNSINEDLINLMRFENCPFNFRLNTIKDRIKNIYSYNFSPINYLIFNDLNNNESINNFMKNTINISLSKF